MKECQYSQVIYASRKSTGFGQDLSYEPQLTGQDDMQLTAQFTAQVTAQVNTQDTGQEAGKLSYK